MGRGTSTRRNSIDTHLFDVKRVAPTPNAAMWFSSNLLGER
jgi:hypothetical protein